MCGPYRRCCAPALRVTPDPGRDSADWIWSVHYPSQPRSPQLAGGYVSEDKLPGIWARGAAEYLVRKPQGLLKQTTQESTPRHFPKRPSCAAAVPGFLPRLPAVPDNCAHCLGLSVGYEALSVLVSLRSPMAGTAGAG